MKKNKRRRVTLSAKPKKGEAKATFLKRCVKKRMGSGDSESQAMSQCVAGWGAERLAADGVRHNLDVSVTLEAAEGDGPRRFAIVGHTGKIINLGYMRFIVDLKGIEHKPQFPVFRQHSALQIVGHVDKVDIKQGAGVMLYGPFSNSTPAAAEVLALADEGFPWQASVGIEAREVIWLDRGKTTKVNGIKVEGPCEVWRKSFIDEVSFVPLGADDDTAGIALSGDHPNENPTEDDMNKKLRMHLEKLGLAKDASDADAQVFLATALADDTQRVSLAKLMTTEEDEEIPTVPATPAAPATVVSDAGGVDLAAQVQGALKLERQRVTTIQQLSRQFNLGTEFVDTHVAADTSAEQIYKLAAEAAAKLNPPINPTARIEFGDDASDKVRRLASIGQSLRLGIVSPHDESIKKDLEAARQFRGYRAVELASFCLNQAGVSTMGMTPTEIATKILSSSVRLSASGSDFRAIYMDIAHKRMLKGYHGVADGWKQLVNTVPANDFKEMYGVSLDAASEFKLVGANGEYPTLKLKDRQESYSIGKYGGIIRLTLEMIVNDDLRAFQRVPQLLGQLGAQKEGDEFFSLLMGDTKMKDGTGLFHADRGNLADAGAAPSHDTISAGRLAMRTQKRNGMVVNVAPQYLMVPASYETASEVLLHSMALPGSDSNSGIKNIWQNRLTPISDARMDLVSNAWFLFGDPNAVDTFEVAYLDGKDEPEVFENESFNTDAIEYKGRHIFGIGAMDSTGIYKNPGETKSQ